MKISCDFDLTNYNSFKIKSKAEYFTKISNKKDLKKALYFAREKNLPVILIGKGTNILLPDSKLKAFVILLNNRKIKQISPNKILAQAGVSISRFINFTLKKELTGAEFLAGIPGSIGGAIFGNAGSFGTSTKDILYQVRVVLTKPPFEEVVFKKRQLKFDYRNSFFKENRGKFIIWEAVFALKKAKKEKVKERIEKNLNYKLSHQPLDCPSAGSFFKNSPLEAFPVKIRKNFKKAGVVKGGFVPTGYLIEKSNLKGKKTGGAEVSLKHGNFIINKNRAKASDIIKLARLVKKRVKNNFFVDLEPEVIILNSKGEGVFL